MNAGIWREVFRANREDGYGTSIFGRIAMATFFGLLFFAAASDTPDLTGYIMAAVFTAAFYGLVIFGLVEDYKDAKERLRNECDLSSHVAG